MHRGYQGLHRRQASYRQEGEQGYLAHATAVLQSGPGVPSGFGSGANPHEKKLAIALDSPFLEASANGLNSVKRSLQACGILRLLKDSYRIH